MQRRETTNDFVREGGADESRLIEGPDDIGSVGESMKN